MKSCNYIDRQSVGNESEGMFAVKPSIDRMYRRRYITKEAEYASCKRCDNKKKRNS